MPSSVTLVKKATSIQTRTGNILMEIEATESDTMEKEVFVKQRMTKPDNTFDDVFVAVATPVQMEDIDKLSPTEDTTYFRDSKISLVCFSAEYAEKVWSDIQAEVGMLVEDVNDMGTLSGSVTVVVT
jgi:hypothetical protein